MPSVYMNHGLFHSSQMGLSFFPVCSC
jgi:hypothetical protein